MTFEPRTTQGYDMASTPARPAAAAVRRSISRRWAIVSAFVAVGLLGALAYTVLSPRRVVARSVVLLPSSPTNGDAPTRDIGTEQRIATSSPVLRKAVEATGVGLSVDELRQRVGASAETSSLLDIQVEDSSASRAIKMSNAVADGYVAYSGELRRRSAASTVRTLRSRAADLGAQRQALEAQVVDQSAKVSALPAGSSAAAAASAELGTLENRLAAVTQDLNDVNQAIDATQLEAEAQVDGLQLLERATNASGPSLSTTLLPFVIAVLVALAMGSAFATWTDRRDDRARRREDIATAIGAPVLASLHARPGSDARALGGMHEPASEADEQTVRQLERRLAHGEDAGTELVVVVLSGDDAALQAVGQLSEAAAQSGLDTALFAPKARQPLDRLLVGAAARGDERGLHPKVYESHRASGDAAVPADLAIVLVITDGASLELPRWSASMPAVMIVSAGFARRAELTTVSAMMRAASRPFSGVIVTNPDPRDGTSAWRVPPAESERVPTRITGLPPEPAR